MKNVILPVDFGETTDKLLEGAIKFSKDIKAKIFIIHVAPAEVGFAIGDMGYQYFPEIEKSEIKAELMRLDALEKKVISEGVDCEHILKKGIARDIILEYAREKKSDYIVIGSHGRSEIYDVFIGSLTKDMTKISPVPVVVIPVHNKK
ncbi:MAG: universal stress protein [Bergeyella sp.]|nr:universal stress protein [Bergeyella sp.]